MNKSLGEYLERMGYMPCYKFPKELDDDEEFRYFEFRVPRHYIREHIKDGNVWPNYEETFDNGSRDDSVVLGVGFFPVHAGVEFLRDDADFLYYKVKVPKLFMNTPISGTPYTYSLLYETKDYKLKSPEEVAEEAAIPKAGEQMPARKELTAIRKVKDSDTLLYEVIFYCSVCDVEYAPEVGSVLWDLLYSRICDKCGNTKLELRGCKSILEETKDE